MTIESNQNDIDVWKISIVSPIIFIPSLEEVFYAQYAESFPSIASFEIKGNANSKLVEIYVNEIPDRSTLISNIADMAKIFNIQAPEIEIEKLENIDWVSESQKVLKPIDAGKFYLFGEHDRDTIPKGKIPILMEAGQAFGTGSHETTMGCLLAIDQLYSQISVPRKILDLGCGSGVLAIAMAKQWASDIVASDIDPVSTQTASDNLKLNDISERKKGDTQSGVYLITSDGFEDENLGGSGPFDLIVANILAKPLIMLAGDIVNNLMTEGTIVLSGLLKEQEKDVLRAYEANGMELENTFPINEWQTLVLKKVRT